MFLWRLLLLAGFWLAWIGLGRQILKLIKLDLDDAPLERTLFCAGAGMQAFSLMMLFLGLAGLWRAALLRGLFCLGAAAGLAGLGIRAPAPEPSRAEPWSGAAILLILGAALLSALACLAPNIFYDALVYHLALPKLYLLGGAIVATPHNIFSGVPFGVEMHYAMALALGQETLPALIHGSLGLATVLALYAWARRRASPATGILAGLLFYLCPAVLVSSSVAGVELGGAFFCMLALMALTRDLEDSSARRRWAVLAGIMAGAAMSTKYNLIPAAGVLILSHLWQARKFPQGPKNSLIAAGAAFLTLLPWLLKNAWFYGNPLYPFLHERLGSLRPADWPAFLASAGARDLRAALTTGAGFKEILLQGWTSSLGNPPASQWPGPAFLLLAPWTLLLRWNAPSFRALAAAAGGCFLAWTLSSRHGRFLIPALPLIALAAAAAVDALPAAARRAGWAAAIACGVLNFQLAAYAHKERGLGSFLAGEQDRSQYLRRVRSTYGQPYYSAMAFINENLPAEARILFLGEARGFYCEREFIASTVFDLNPFWAELRRSRDGGELQRRLKALGVTHLFFNAGDFASRRDSNVVMPRQDIRGTVFEDFWSRYLKKVFDDQQAVRGDAHWVLVYELLETPAAQATPNPAREIVAHLEKNQTRSTTTAVP